MQKIAGASLIQPSSTPKATPNQRGQGLPTFSSNDIADDSPITSVVPRTTGTPTEPPCLDGSIVNEDFVNLLSSAADSLTASIGPDTLNNPSLQTWCEQHGIDTSPRKDRMTILAKHCILNLLLKATLYEYHHRHSDLPPLSSDIRVDFQHAQHVIEEEAFSERPIDMILWQADADLIAPIVEARGRLLSSRNPAEDIGNLYETLTTSDSRHMLGQFRTPPDIGRLMRSWVTNTSSTVLDPGIGAGTLSSPFYPGWKTSSDPQDVVGIDQSPLSMLMGTTALTLCRQPHELRTRDFLSVSPSDLPNGIGGIVSNPPYTGSESLPENYKRQRNAQFEEVTDGAISAKSPLYTYFVYHSQRFLDAGDRVAFLTPQSWLSRRFGEPLKQFLLEEFRIKSLVRFDPETTSIFQTADETALLLFLEATAADTPRGDTKFIRVDKDIDADDLRDVISGTVTEELSWGEVLSRRQEQLDPADNWQSLFEADEIETPGLVPLQTLASCHRGTVTGAARFFCLSQQTVDEYEISERHLTRIVRRPSVVDGYDFTESDWQELQDSGTAVWLLTPDKLSNVPADIDTFAEGIRTGSKSRANDAAEAQVQSYLRTAVTNHDLTGNNTFDQREQWYRPRSHDSPQVVVPDSSRNGFPFIMNEMGARNIHNFHGLHEVRLDNTELKALLAYLNSEFAARLLQKETHPRQTGYRTLSISTLRNLPVINPTEAPESVVQALAKSFDELCRTTRCSGDPALVQELITEILERELGLRLPSGTDPR